MWRPLKSAFNWYVDGQQKPANSRQKYKANYILYLWLMTWAIAAVWGHERARVKPRSVSILRCLNAAREHLLVSDQHHSLTSTAAALTGWTAAVFSWTGGGFFIVATGGTSFTGSSPCAGQQGHSSSLHPTVRQIQRKLWESQRMTLWAKVINWHRKTPNQKI